MRLLLLLGMLFLPGERVSASCSCSPSSFPSCLGALRACVRVKRPGVRRGFFFAGLAALLTVGVYSSSWSYAVVGVSSVTALCCARVALAIPMPAPLR